MKKQLHMLMNLSEITKKIRHLDILSKRNANDVFVGNYRSSFKGQGLEIADIRKYEEGDDIRHIDWITTAKQGTPFIKLFQESRERTTMIIIDVSSSMNFTSTGVRKKEKAIETAATLLFSALKNNDKTGALIFSDTIESYIPPKKGRGHVLRILREILYQYDKNTYKKSDQYQALKFFNSVIRRHCIAFFLSDQITQDSHKLLRTANQKHDFVFIHFLDPFEKGITIAEPMEIENPETGQTMIINLTDKHLRSTYKKIRQRKQQELERLLMKNNIDRVDISTQTPIYQELLAFFQMRQRRS